MEGNLESREERRVNHVKEKIKGNLWRENYFDAWGKKIVNPVEEKLRGNVWKENYFDVWGKRE